MSTEASESALTGASLHSRLFTAWKFKILDGLIRDPDMKSVDLHIALALLQLVNQYTRLARITDRRLQEIVHKDRKSLMTARKRLKRLGWLEVDTGCYGKASEYKFLEERADRVANDRLDQQILNDEEDDRNDAKAPHYVKRRNGAKSPHCKTEAKAPHGDPQWGENGTRNGEVLHPLHLIDTKIHPLSVQDVALVAQGLSVFDAHVHAFDAWHACEEEAARLQYDEGLPRQEAEHAARILCGLDETDADSRQGAGTAPTTSAKVRFGNGMSDGRDDTFRGPGAQVIPYAAGSQGSSHDV